MLKKIFSRPKPKQTVYWLLAIVAVLAVVALLISFTDQQKLNAEREANNRRQADIQEQITRQLRSIEAMTPAEGTASGVAGEYGLIVKTQTLGTAVIVDSAVMGSNGFLVIHADNGKKQPGDIISGSQLLNRGAYNIVSIAVPSTVPTNIVIPVSLLGALRTRWRINDSVWPPSLRKYISSRPTI